MLLIRPILSRVFPLLTFLLSHFLALLLGGHVLVPLGFACRVDDRDWIGKVHNVIFIAAGIPQPLQRIALRVSVFPVSRKHVVVSYDPVEKVLFEIVRASMM